MQCELDKKGVLTSKQHVALNDLTGLLNSAVHGEKVAPQTAASAVNIAPDLLEPLNRLIEPTGPKMFVQSNEPKFLHRGDLWLEP